MSAPLRTGLRSLSRLASQGELDAAVKHLTAQGYDANSIWEQRVVWGDHDQFQHVNNVHYVRWFESARMYFAERLIHDAPDGLFTPLRTEEIMRGTGKSFILASINVRYRRPVT